MLYTTTKDKTYHPATATIDPTGYGKVAIVTGCASGIGLATTQLLLARQFSVCGLDNAEFDYGLVRQEDHGRFHFHRADLTAVVVGDDGDDDDSGGGCEEGVRICLSTFGYVFFFGFSFSFSSLSLFLLSHLFVWVGLGIGEGGYLSGRYLEREREGCGCILNDINTDTDPPQKTDKESTSW
jgi:hypothetical protein